MESLAPLLDLLKDNNLLVIVVVGYLLFGSKIKEWLRLTPATPTDPAHPAPDKPDTRLIDILQKVLPVLLQILAKSGEDKRDAQKEPS